MRYNALMISTLVLWWYGDGWRKALRRTPARLDAIVQQFSVQQLSRTLFDPWRRIVSGGGRNLQERLQDGLGNAVSRFVGFFARLFVLITAGVALIVVSVAGLIEIVAWPLMPLAILYCVARSMLG